MGESLASFLMLVAYAHFKEVAGTSTFFSTRSPTAAVQEKLFVPLGDRGSMPMPDPEEAQLLRDDLLGPGAGSGLTTELAGLLTVELGERGEVLEFSADDGSCGDKEPVTLDPADHPSIQFFRVVAKAPHSLKRCRTDLDIKLPVDQSAVVLHDFAHVDRKDRVATVKLQPAAHPFAASSALALFNGASHIKFIHSWERRRKLMFLCGKHDQHSQEESRALEACVAAQAWDGEDAALELDESVRTHAELVASLRTLLEKKVVCCIREEGTRSSWQISRTGPWAIDTCVVLDSPKSATIPRKGLHVRDMTSWELIQHLKGTGWDTQMSSRGTPPPVVRSECSDAGPKVIWFKHGNKTARWHYLLALASLEKLPAHVKELFL